MLADYINPPIYPYFPRRYWPSNWPTTTYQYWPWIHGTALAYRILYVLLENRTLKVLRE